MRFCLSLLSIFFAFVVAGFFAPSAFATIYFIGTDHQRYELSQSPPYQWKLTGSGALVPKVSADDISMSPNGEMIVYGADGSIKRGEDPKIFQRVPMDGLPAVTTFKSGHVDAENNFWLEKNDGFHFLSDETNTWIPAGQVHWADGRGPTKIQSMVASPKESGVYVALTDGSIEKISPLQGGKSFSRAPILPAGSAKSIHAEYGSIVVDQGGGNVALLVDGALQALPSPPSDGQVFANADRHYQAEMQKYVEHTPAVSRLVNPKKQAETKATEPEAKIAGGKNVGASPGPTAPVKSFSSRELEKEIALRRSRVPEFQFIKEEAKKLGVRVWLFGGTASGYGHYVNWDMRREHGDARFQADRFNYDYSNIYRSTQDLDVVMDGTEEQARILSAKLEETFPHFQGSKTAWEVRLLKKGAGDKEALLHNPNYLNQHTDSNSTGMIELSDPPRGEEVVRDLRDWNSKDPFFLRDLHDERLHYYFSDLHGTTTRAMEGKNPPILSVIRYLTKAFQYDLELRPEDVKQVQKIIKDFDPKTPMDSYVSGWIEKNGKKLMQNAVNLEYAWKKLKEMGLSKKLASIKGNAKEVDSLAWWMNKQPLLSSKVGQGDGLTAAEIFKIHKIPKDKDGRFVVAHEPNNYLAYESITRAHTGEPNVLGSRKDAEGEVAAFGDGFYTKAGREGAAGTGLHIRFELSPDAREETDFHFVPGSDFFVMENRAAFRVIPESLNLGLKEFFEVLVKDDSLFANDKGVLEKLRRQVLARAAIYGEKEVGEVAELIKNNLNDRDRTITLLSEWVRIPQKLRAHFDKEVGEAAAAKPELGYELGKLSAAHKAWEDVPEIMAYRSEYERWSRPLIKHIKDLDEIASAAGFGTARETVAEACVASLVKVLQKNTKDPAFSRATRFVEDVMDHPPGNSSMSFKMGDRTEVIRQFLETLPKDAPINTTFFEFAVRWGVSGMRQMEFAEGLEKELLARYFRPGQEKASVDTMKTFLTALGGNGYETMVINWDRYGPFFGASSELTSSLQTGLSNKNFASPELAFTLRYSLAHKLHSLPEDVAYEETPPSELLPRLREYLRGYRKNILPIHPSTVLDDSDEALDKRVYGALKNMMKGEFRNEARKKEVVRAIYEELILPEGSKLPESADFITRAVSGESWFHEAVHSPANLSCPEGFAKL